MRRSSLALVSGALIASAYVYVSGQTVNCRDCQPGLYNYSAPSGDYRIGFEPGQFSSTEEQALLYGAQYWNGSPGPFVQNAPASYNQADIAFFVQNDLSGTNFVAIAHISSDGRGSIGVNPDRLNDARSYDFWSWVGAHEIGHMFDFTDVNVSGCGGMTVMFGTIGTNPGTLPFTQCSDSAAFTDKFGMPPGGSYCDYGCPPGYTTACVGDQQPDPNNCDCCINYTPIVLDLSGDGFLFSDAQRGVTFPINACGSTVRVGWPESDDDVWLALDRNRNGRIDDGSELFGNAVSLKDGGFAVNGYMALAEWDDNGDQWVDADDAVFPSLRLWNDANRNGISEPLELQPLLDRGVEGIGLRYRKSPHRDAWGNEFHLMANVRTRTGMRRSADVIPVTLSGGQRPKH